MSARHLSYIVIIYIRNKSGKLKTLLKFEVQLLMLPQENEYTCTSKQWLRNQRTIPRTPHGRKTQPKVIYLGTTTAGCIKIQSITQSIFIKQAIQLLKTSVSWPQWLSSAEIYNFMQFRVFECNWHYLLHIILLTSIFKLFYYSSVNSLWLLVTVLVQTRHDEDYLDASTVESKICLLKKTSNFSQHSLKSF